NGGGFLDEGGMGNGGIPLGVVVENGVFRFGDGCGMTNVIGFDKNNVLHVGFMNSKQIKERSIRDAVTFGPPLIVNSVPTKTIGNGGGLNPRTAIGQRKDGSVLLLAIDGRQPHSLGASYKDLVDVMQKFGAVNAGNLDGGSSSMMIYKGQAQTESVSIYGERKIASGFIVKP
ncbi:MAG: phosphodiester glycosidase family protein, partial [Oscillospiraceae bacterium]